MIKMKTTDNEISLILSRFGRLDIEENEHPRETFSVGLLDVFDHQLTNKEAVEKIVTYTSKDKGYKHFTNVCQIILNRVLFL